MTDLLRRLAEQARVPLITCPMCGGKMRLALAEPEKSPALRLTFDCWCGFEYRMSDGVAKEIICTL